MAVGFSNEEITRHNRLYQEACDLLRGEIMVDGQPLPSKPGLFARRRLQKAISLFEEVIKMNPDNWGAVFGIAKALQSLGEPNRAFDLMLKAHRGDPNVSGYAREAGIVAVQLGRFREGIALAEEAIETRPGDGSLYSNLGLAHLLDGNVGKGIDAFQRAIELEPNHPLTPRLLALAKAVQAGELPQPRSEAEVSKAV